MRKVGVRTHTDTHSFSVGGEVAVCLTDVRLDPGLGILPRTRAVHAIGEEVEIHALRVRLEVRNGAMDVVAVQEARVAPVCSLFLREMRRDSAVCCVKRPK